MTGGDHIFRAAAKCTHWLLKCTFNAVTHRDAASRGAQLAIQTYMGGRNTLFDFKVTEITIATTTTTKVFNIRLQLMLIFIIDSSATDNQG